MTAYHFDQVQGFLPDDRQRNHWIVLRNGILQIDSFSGLDVSNL
jgi:hypothetical protein